MILFIQKKKKNSEFIMQQTWKLIIHSLGILILLIPVLF